MKTDGYEKLDRLHTKITARFGKEITKEIFEIIMQELGDERVTISFGYYNRKIRNRQIKNNFYGGNYEELAIRFNCTEKQIRRIVHSDE